MSPPVAGPLVVPRLAHNSAAEQRMVRHLQEDPAAFPLLLKVPAPFSASTLNPAVVVHHPV
eukprot:514360-Prorocentrum_minimum.AAC.1